jgi:hypothetical protein
MGFGHGVSLMLLGSPSAERIFAEFIKQLLNSFQELVRRVATP